MGKGDKRTKKGKIFAGSHGKSRPKHKKKGAAAPQATTEAAPKKTTRKKKSE